MSEVFDLVVIGGGPGGYVAAIRAAQLGLKTACIEKRGALGGTCLNVGCIPSKALLDSSEHYHFAKEKMFKHGVKVSGVELDLKTMMARKDGVVKTLTTGIAGLFKKNKVEYFIGAGKFSGKSGNVFEVDVQLNSGEKSKVQAKKVLIATGSEPIELPFLKFDGKDVISSTEALALTDVPKRLCVVGGGVIGLEMGSVWSRLGSKVTVIEFAPKIAGKADQQMSNELEKSLRKQGFDFMLSTKCLGAEKRGNEWAVKFEKLNGNEKGEILVDKILVSVGRKPYTENLGLEKVGLAVDEKGRIPIDDHFQSKVPGIYAVGDVVDGPMLAHKAEEEGIAVVELMVGQAGHVNYEIIPDVIYTWPELAAVGYSEDDLKARNHAYKVGTFPFMANGRAKAMDEVEGLVKIISDAKTDKVLGVHILGPRASDLIPEAVSVMEFGGSAEDIARTCHAHPTLSEAVKEAALAVDKRAIHF